MEIECNKWTGEKIVRTRAKKRKKKQREKRNCEIHWICTIALNNINCKTLCGKTVIEPHFFVLLFDLRLLWLRNYLMRMWFSEKYENTNYNNEQKNAKKPIGIVEICDCEMRHNAVVPMLKLNTSTNKIVSKLCSFFILKMVDLMGNMWWVSVCIFVDAGTIDVIDATLRTLR